MATLHHHDRGLWRRVDLDPADSPIALSALTNSGTRSTGTAPDGLLLSHVDRDDGEGEWLLHVGCTRPVFVNGMAVDTCIRVLGDRDAIGWGAGHGVWVSLERRARVEPFPGAADELRCPRCHLPLEPGCDAVRCVGCGVWHHEAPDDELACWSHACICAACPQPTAIDDEAGWSPAFL